MAKINVLPSAIFNRIAAGEVVERPASVVKELIDNCIDARATQISIKITAGGKSSIVVTDDGMGIEKEDLRTALLPHATSKIFCLEDLDDIETLGFRGEALASIASVSRIKIVSKPKEQKMGACISAEGGVIGEYYDCSAVDGTEVTVNNLFYNTPAREKFLKRDKTEESEITNIVTRMILGNPDISFSYYVDGVLTLQSYGEGLESAMVSVYGLSILKDCHYLNYDFNGIHIEGYVGRANFSKTTKNFQTVFINKRYIVNGTITAAMNNVYAVYMMKRRYPFYVLNLTIPTEVIDCNVNPSKTDVRILDNSIVYVALYTEISKILYESRSAYNITSNDPDHNKFDENSDKPHLHLNFNTRPYSDRSPLKKFTIEPQPKPNFPVDTRSKEEKANDKNFTYSALMQKMKKEGTTSLEFEDGKLVYDRRNDAELYPKSDIFAENKAFIEELEKKKADSDNIQGILDRDFKDKPFEQPILKYSEVFVQPKYDVGKNYNYIGQILNTYIIVEDGVDVFLIDQHAAHERILFDKFQVQVMEKNIETQPLLLPYIFTVNSNEIDFIIDNIKIMQEMGIDISEFGGNSFKVSAIPVCLSEMNIKNFFDDLLADLVNMKSITLASLMKDKIAQKACKAAIKAGDKLSEGDMQSLMTMLEYDLGLKCPHGRPIAVRITKTEIEKWFKRIV